MIEKTIQIQTDDGEMETFIAHPEGDAASPVVVLYMDAPGIREELYEFARRIAAEGYFCVLPDLYYRAGRIRFDLAKMTADEGREMFGHMRALSNAAILSDTRAILAALKNQPQAGDGPKGCLGYCMSGQFIMSVAGTFPDDFRAAVSCYGVGIVTDRPDTPHRLAGQLRGEALFAFAEIDEYVSDDVIPVLEKSLENAAVLHEIKIYAGTHHGFCFPERGALYNEDAAEAVWLKTFAMFERQLR